MVGAVLLRGGQVLGEGYHREFGAPHAEVAALAACPDAEGATCVVNLEPCSHLGKTPACTDALVAAGVRRVVFAVRDPHRAAAGGADALIRAGVEVECGLLREQAAALNAPFLWAETRTERPFVALKLATSLDGFVADEWHKSQWITGPEAREHVHWLRTGFDGVAVGRATAEVDDPQLTARGATVPRKQPTRVVFGRSGLLDPKLRLVRSAGEISSVLLVDPGSRSQAEDRLTGTGVRVVAGEGLVGKLHELRAMAIRSLLVEGGPRLAAELLERDLADRIYLYQAPILLGQGLAAFATRQPVRLDAAVRWVPVERKAFGDSNLIVVDRKICLPE
jgi:diaminohydroxyphosphoribosylaminopyrimidine deaminase/5-amino-6-(5-phosphoribosylamino)uracil reductase